MVISGFLRLSASNQRLMDEVLQDAPDANFEGSAMPTASQTGRTGEAWGSSVGKESL
jgi:hypothetical protein